jgi:hypothetical protein
MRNGCDLSFNEKIIVGKMVSTLDNVMVDVCCLRVADHFVAVLKWNGDSSTLGFLFSGP